MYMKDDNPESVTREALLRFLETVPSGAARRGPDSMMAEERPAPDGPNLACPSPERYMDVALGTGGVEQSYALLEHAASCSECAGVLASSLRALEGNPSAEESAALAELAEQRVWLERMAEALSATPARKRPLAVMETIRYGGRRWRWLAAAAAAALVAAAGAGIMWQRHATAPENLLAKAYQQSRTLELRIPEAGFANLAAGTHTRGAAGDYEPAPLLEARAGLARKLQTSPEDARLLELQARADVLAEHYDRAVDVLDRLLAAGPVTAELLTDGAMAYYQRGLVSNRELDRSTALDYLRRADEIAPTDPVVLFNEAVVMEDRGQMMNAVEVWNRYLTVERDGAWAREGKRKLAALEAALNRLKSHESRVDKMLATPEAMDALAGDPAELASLDEELSTYRLMRMTQRAFPEARGSPCDDFCQAARRLLQATGKSLENHHHDFWLSDLLPASFDALPVTSKDDYAQAMRLLGRAAYENQFGLPVVGKGLAEQARSLFAALKERSGGNAAFHRVMITGEYRSAVEYLYGLQRTIDFRGCRAFAQQLHTGTEFQAARALSPSIRYPWVEGMEMVAEKICDDTPETRAAGRKLEAQALLLAETSSYPLLRVRVELRIANDAQNAGDEETYERLRLAVFHELVSMDPPLTRIVQTVASAIYVDRDSPRTHMNELVLRETLPWTEAAGSDVAEIAIRMELVDAEMRIGARTEAENQLRKASSEIAAHGWAKSRAVDVGDADTTLARSMLERGDTAAAARFLNDASGYIHGDSDIWLQRRYDAALGQLDLTRKDYDQARGSLESNIRMSEGKSVRQVDRVVMAEYAEQDHDIYAELAATWLALGRSPISVLGLWERFQMRSRGLPVPVCAGGALDCEERSLLAEQHRLGSNILIGQILLLDRVLVYRMDNHGVTWTEKPVRRQDVLNAAQTLERAVSSPFTSMATAAQLGAHLSDVLLPGIPAKLDPDAALLLEPDPMLQNLSWPVLPTPAGPLGLRYPMAEVTSILADSTLADRALANPGLIGAGHTRVVDGKMNHALVVGASVAEDEPPLPDALTEAQAVNGFLHAPDLLLGDQATAARVAQRMATATIFHFAGHAVQSRDGTELLLASVSPGSVSLGSASSGAEKQRARPWIDGTFLRQHPPRACRLAVLSACATGQREASWNHPLQDIVETLRSLGVPEVVATRWQIDSEASVPFMNSFYESLKEGSSVAAALTVARRVQSGRSSYASPYYWGAYYVSGREAMRFTGEFYGHL